MPKPNDDIQDLKRRVALLDRLDGRALTTAEGPVLLEPIRVRDPRPLVAACLAGRPPLAAVRASIELASPPIELTPSLLAAARRDLRALEASPELLAVAREAPRIFRRYGPLDATWLARRRAVLASLAERARGAAEGLAPAGMEGGVSAWFARALEAIDLVHGEGAADAVRGALLHLEERGRARRLDARRTLDEVRSALAGDRAPRLPAAAEAALGLRAAATMPGRSRARRVAALLGRLLGVPAVMGDHVDVDRLIPIEALVRAAGDRLLARMETPRSPAFRDEALRFFAHYALAFDPRPRGGGALALGPADVRRGLAELDKVSARFGGKKLTIPEVLALSELGLDEGVARKVEEGLAIDKVRRLAELGRAADLAKIEGAEAASSYAEWASALVPHYAALGLDFPVPPETFEDLRASRKIDLAVLAACLMKHHARASQGGAEEAMRRLDATLGLFRRRPAEAASILAELSGTSPGAGREAFPAFAAWLGDDALLDRFVHLARLAGEPVALSQALRADFDRREAQDRERAYLAARAARSPAQDERLRRLDAGEVEVPDPARTRRRLAERVRALLDRAYEARLDAVFRRILKEVWGISIPRLTPGFRDALRFYLALDDNRDLLGALLRAAAAGVDPARTMPRNRAWMDGARARFDVDAWRAPFAREVVIGGHAHRLAAEDDPIEVLRMGIPFDTCLSLERGCNRASTVVNAVDANKRVLYLRDARGHIVARKLLAVTPDPALIGYRLYIAAEDDHEAIVAAFRDACERIAAAARLPLAPDGKPDQIHPGFWYDDGTVPFDGQPEVAPIKAYCRALGRPSPRLANDDLRREARVFGAIRREDPEALLAALRDGWKTTSAAARAVAFLQGRLDRGRLVAEARRSTVLAGLLIRDAAEREGPRAMLDLAGSIADWRSAEVAEIELARVEPSADVADAYASAALASRRNAPSFDDHALEHRSLHTLPRLVSTIPIAAALGLCDRIAPLWAWIEEVQSECGVCRRDGENRMVEAIADHYAAAPDPAAVIRCLEVSRSSALAERAALAIAARHALGEGALRAIARLRKRSPALDANPVMLAAILRQAGTTSPRGIELPVPDEAPFEALGDLILDLDLAPLLTRWAGPGQRSHLLEAGIVELAFHRRHPTGRRRAIAKEFRRLASRGSVAASWLGSLGDAEILDTLGPSRALEEARVVAAQLEAARTGELPTNLELVLPRSFDGLRLPVDAGLLRAALARIDRHLAGSDEPRSFLDVAFSIALRGELDRDALKRIVERLFARGVPLDEAERDFVAGYLTKHASLACPHLTPALVVSIWQEAGLRRELLQGLGRIGDDLLEATYRGVLSAARRAGGEHLVEGLFEAWAGAILDSGDADPIADLDDEALLRRAIRVAIAKGSPSQVLELYRDMNTHEQASIFLDELSRSAIPSSPLFPAALDDMKRWMEDPDHAARAEWLRGCVASAPGEG